MALLVLLAFSGPALRLLILFHRLLLTLGLLPVVPLLLLHGALGFALILADGFVFFAGKGRKRRKTNDGEQNNCRDAFHDVSDCDDLNIGTPLVSKLEGCRLW
jgi:hypothetical protein